MLKLEASTGTLFAEHIDQDPLFFGYLKFCVLEGERHPSWQEFYLHINHRTIEVLGGRGADVVPGFLFCHAHHHLTSIDSKEFRILSACRPPGQPLLFISSV